MIIVLNNIPLFHYNKASNKNLSFKQNKHESANSAKVDDISGASHLRIKPAYQDALKYLEEARELCKFSYVQKEEAEKLLGDAIMIMNDCKITGYKPVDKKCYYDSGELFCEIFPRCVSNESNGTNYDVNHIYDTVLKEYRQDGTIKQETVFSRIPNPNKYDFSSMQKITKAPFVSSIREYDENGKLVRKIEGSYKNVANVNGITLYDDNEDEKVSFSFANKSLLSCFKGGFVSNHNLLRCPLIFEFDKDELTCVKRNLTYYGFSIINCETFNFEDGNFLDYEKYKEPLYG